MAYPNELPAPQGSSRRRALLIWSAAILAVAVLPLGVFLGPPILGQMHLASVRRELVAKGEKLDPADFQAPAASLEDDYFSMEFFRKSAEDPSALGPARRLKEDLDRIQIKSQGPRIVGASPDFSTLSIRPKQKGEAPSPDPVATLGQLLAPWQYIRDDAVAFKGKRGANSQIESEGGATGAGPFLTAALQLCGFLRWHFLLAMQQQRTGDAFEDILALARLAKALEESDYSIGVYVSQGNWSRVREMIEEGMERWSPEQLGRLQEVAAMSAPTFSSMAKSLRLERARLDGILDKEERKGNLGEGFRKLSGEKLPWWSHLLLYSAWANYLAAAQEHIECWMDPGSTPADFQALDQKSASLHEIEAYLHFLERMALPGSSPAYKVFRYQDEAKMTQVAIALELWRRSHGAYPEKLSELLPELPREVSTGSIPGQTFQYKRTSPHGYIIWSYGWNGTDEGGKYEKMYSRDGDWILQGGPDPAGAPRASAPAR